MIPTRAEMEAFEFDPMSTAASDAGTFEGGVQRDAQAILNAITGLDWSGKAKFAASDRAIDESSDRKAVAKALGDIADAARSGQSALSGCKSDSLSATKGYEADGYNVAQDWTVTDGYNYGLADALAVDDPAAQRRLAALKASRANTAKNATVKLKKLALDFHTADQACRSKLNAAVGALGSLAPVVAGLNPKAADGIVDALRSGKRLTAAQLQQLQAATNLTPEQLEALRTGHYAEIPQGQHSFMRTLLSGLDGMSVTDIRGLGAEGQQDQVQRALSNAMQLSSAPNVGTSAGDQGGMGLLPSNVRSLLQSNLIKGYDSARVPFIPRYKEFIALGEVLQSGSSQYRMGTDFDRGMLKQISELSAAREGLGSGYSEGSGHPTVHGPALDQSISKSLSALSHDTAAVHDFITGNNMNVTCDNGGEYNAKKHLDGLLSFGWGEGYDPRGVGTPGGTGVTGIDDVFRALQEGSSSTNPFISEQSRAAVNSFGHYLGSESSAGETDFNLDTSKFGENGDLGKRSPHLTRTISELMSQYLGGFSGAPGGAEGVETFDATKMSQKELDGLFKVLNSDPESAETINTASARWQNYMAYLAQLQGDGGGGLANATGLLAQSTEDGFNAQLKALQGYEKQELSDSYQRGVNLYTTGASAVGAIPHPAASSAAAAALSPQAMAAFFGSPPTDSDAFSSDAVQEMKKIEALSISDPEAIQFSQFTAYAEQHPDVREEHPDWFTDGKPDPTKMFTDKVPGGEDRSPRQEFQRFMNGLAQSGEFNGWTHGYNAGRNEK